MVPASLHPQRGAWRRERQNPIMTEPTNEPTNAPSQATPSRPALPDRLSVDPRSRHYVAAVVEHAVGVRLGGKERFDVEEYCISEGWVKVPAGRTLDRKGQPLMIQLKGAVEVFYR